MRFDGAKVAKPTGVVTLNLLFKICPVLLLSFAVTCSGSLHAKPPDLVLMITVDQLRGDMPWRAEKRFGPAGFRYFFERGTVYTNAHYSHLVTTTAAGHATLATGANTPRHGIAGNEWYDQISRQAIYNTEDQEHPVLGVNAVPSEGRSPHNLVAGTFGDQLVQASAGKSRVFSVSIKDRGAIIPGGQLGKAFWYSKYTGKFVTSTYYYPRYPDWVVQWNAAGHAEQFKNTNWELLQERDRYVYRNQDDRWFEKPEYGMGRTFPHPLPDSDDESYYSALRATPMGDELTLSFLKALVDAESVGSGDHTDILAVSFSVTDYIGHDFGPNSLEAEDNLLRLDRTLQDLLGFIDDRVGLQNALVVLSSDHGVAPSPERMNELGVAAERHQPEQFMQQANEALRARFKTDSDLVLKFLKPGVYLDEEAILAEGLNLAEVERALADEFMQMPGFAGAFSRSDLLAGTLPDSQLVRTATRSVHRVRSGNVIIVHDSFWLLSGEPDDNAATHGSPYAYDTHVPIMLAGPRISQQRISTRVSPRDVAPTICTYLGISPPPAATGHPLPGLGMDISTSR